LVMLLAGCGPEVTATPAPAAPPTDTPVPSKVEGEAEGLVPPTAPPSYPGLVIDKWALWADGTHLRGANIYQRRVYPELDGPEFMGPGPVGPPYTQADFDNLAALGANYVNISHPGLFTETPPYTLDQGIQDNLDQLLDMIAQADMFAVISSRTGPGRAEFSVCCLEEAGDWYDESYLNDSVWQDAEAQDAWAAMWRYTAERYRDHPIVVGYDLMVEPNSNEVWLELWDPEEFYTNYGDTLYDWNQLYPRITAAIREVDPDTPILIGAMAYSAVEWLPYLQPTGDPHTVYAVHQYAPVQYTHQWHSPEFTYPGGFDTDWDGEDDQFNRAWLEDLLSTVDDFASTHGAPVTVNEFGLVRWVPGAAEFMDDQMDLFEQRGMNYALWEWASSWEPHAENDAFDFRHGSDPDHHAEVESSDLMDVIFEYWERNTIRPSSGVESPDSAAPLNPPMPMAMSPFEARLADVTRWFYMIDANLEPEMVERVATSEYDMVVLDFIPSEENNTDYPMADVIAQLHNPPHHFDCAQCKPKLVIAYVDIGQAEEYRTYWQPDWGIGDPEWIVGLDPDGWEGNYPVAYWYDEWHDIWLGENGYLQAILDAGFDGVYLDWVEAYSDENVIAIAEQEDVDPRQEMIWWIGDIADFTRDQRPDFVVIAQNAAELAEDGDYLAIIDAIAQEQVWFDGGADNEPPGDCPLPRTEAEVDSEAYRQSLSSPCRKQYDDYPDSTLHVSSEEYLSSLTLARDKGKIIFTVDYALEPDNVAWVYETSRALGFVPFASNRALDRYVEPVP
jgi:cysteinyl-tRNA synthetase